MLIALLFLVASLLIFFDLIEPAYGDLETKKGEQVSSEQFLMSEQQLVTKAKNLLTQYENDSQAEANLALAMPSGPDIAGGLAQVYGITTESGLSVQGITIGAPSVQVQDQEAAAGTTLLTASQIVKPMGTLSFQINGAGSYENFKSFLQMLETNIRIFDVTNVSLQPAASAPSNGKAAVNQDLFTYGITVVTYYQTP